MHAHRLESAGSFSMVWIRTTKTRQCEADGDGCEDGTNLPVLVQSRSTDKLESSSESLSGRERRVSQGRSRTKDEEDAPA